LGCKDIGIIKSELVEKTYLPLHFFGWACILSSLSTLYLSHTNCLLSTIGCDGAMDFTVRYALYSEIITIINNFVGQRNKLTLVP